LLDATDFLTKIHCFQPPGPVPDIHLLKLPLLTSPIIMDGWSQPASGTAD
jgi:hypothetical protein